ncbi:hypothetical protein ACWDCC_40055 [Streptomyces sp. NPDC001102]
MNDIILNAPQDRQRNPKPSLLYELRGKGARSYWSTSTWACGRH